MTPNSIQAGKAIGDITLQWSVLLSWSLRVLSGPERILAWASCANLEGSVAQFALTRTGMLISEKNFHNLVSRLMVGDHGVFPELCFRQVRGLGT